MVKFKDNEFLGKTVKNTRIYCAIGVEPIKDIFQLRYAGGGNKFSSLCGFMFDTAAEGSEFPRFMISFVSKLRSKIYRQQQSNPSQWFIFRRINKNRVDVLDKKALLVNYGFDIDKFFDSDLFKSCLPKFEKCLKKGLVDAENFANAQKDDAVRKECIRYIKSINESLPILMSSKRVNDKYFQLNDLDALAKDASAGVSDEDKKKALDAKLAAISKGNKKFMDKVAANQRDVDYAGTAEESEDSGNDVNEAKNIKDFECKVEKKKEDGKDVWEVNELSGRWVATFQDQQTAESFAKEYPALKAKHIEKAAAIESESDDKLDESSSKPMTVKDVLDDVNQWVKDDDEWSKAKFVVNAPDGKTYCIVYSGTTEDVPGGAYFVECGKEINLKKLAKEADDTEKKEEPVKEKEDTELDEAIEESLKEIYK